MTLLISIWLLLGALVIVCLRPILGGWGTPAVVVWPIYILLGLALAAASVSGALRPGAPPGLRSLRPLFVFALGSGVLFAIHPLLARFSDARAFRARMEQQQSAYDSLLSGPPADSSSGPWRWHGTLAYWPDSGPPLRLAVLQPGRSYDGIEVAVYDPAGRLDTVGAATGADRPFAGRISGCSAVRPPWYRCLLRGAAR
jgi:hypothetical protein